MGSKTELLSTLNPQNMYNEVLSKHLRPLLMSETFNKPHLKPLPQSFPPRVPHYRSIQTPATQPVRAVRNPRRHQRGSTQLLDLHIL